jgi:putative endonuclease
VPDSVNKHAAGLRGQKAAEAFLVQSGYEILHRNYRVRTGEIDLVARHNDYIVFVEVKFRKSTNYGLPRESVGYAKQQKITRTALHFIAKHKLDNNDFRFDVIEILEQNEKMYANHIQNAF